MAHIDIGEGGFSFWSVVKDEMMDAFANDQTVRMGLLPSSVSPYEKQLRVVVNGLEYTYDDGTDPSLTNLWSYISQPEPEQGLMITAIKLIFKREGSGNPQSAQFGLKDGNGEWYTDLIDDDTVFLLFGDHATSTTERLFDGNGSTVFTGNGAGDRELVISFITPRAVSAFGWTGDNNPSASSITEMAIEVNVGTGRALLDDFNFVVVPGARTGILQGDYSDPDDFEPDKDFMVMDIPASIGSADDIAKNPTIQVTPPLTADGDRFTVFRETRQDRPHNPPTGGARVSSDNLHWFFTQRLYIMQDICEYQALSGFIDFAPYTEEEKDLTAGFQVQSHLNHGGNDTFLFDEVELLQGVPGALDLANQIVVEEGNREDGTSTVWTEGSYTVNSTALTVTRTGGATDDDVRIRRVTKLDDLWIDIRDRPVSWNSRHIVLLAKQVRFLVEEACFVPVFFQGSILANTIFPREWNWLIYTGTPLFHIFGGPLWTGDGIVTVFDDDLPLTTPTDYRIEYPAIYFTGPIIQPHHASSGDYWGQGSPMLGGGDGGEEDDPSGANEPTNDGAPIDPNEPAFVNSINLSISVTMVPQSLVNSGPLEGFPNGVNTSQGNGSSFENNMYLRVQLTVTQAFAGESQNASTIAYCNTICPGFPSASSGLRAVAQASDTNGDGSFNATHEGSAATGCGDTAATVAAMISMWNNWLAHRGGAYGRLTISRAEERAADQIFRASGNSSIDQLRNGSLMAGLNSLVQQNQASGADGTTTDSDINDILGP